MNLSERYDKVDKILDELDFRAIFPGFREYKYALYDSEQICLDGRLIPYNESFMGNTSISYENEYIAIWDIEADPIEDPEMLAYSIVHEMFHCFQKDNGETRYPSDLTLLNYPDDVDNYLKKYNENRCLADAYENHDIESFKKFHAFRNERLKKYPDMVLQELRAETLEGGAEYAGLIALSLIDPEKFRAVTEGYVRKLRAEDELIFDIRKISYYSGAVYFLCMKAFGIAEGFTLGGDRTAYEEHMHRFNGNIAVEMIPCDAVSRNYSRLAEKKRAIISDHISRSSFTPCNAYICGYDPMNMFRMEDIIYCSHFVCLSIEENVQMLKAEVALQVKGGSTKEITGYYLK